MDILNVELKLLHCLVALVEESSVTRAAERLNVSQPRMSNSLRRLRKLCDDPLLVRAGRGLVPTDRAFGIVNQVRKGLEQITSGLSNSSSFEASTSRRNFNIMMSDYTAAMLLAELLCSITEEAPNIGISIVPVDHNNVRKLLEDGECDVAFGYFQTLEPNLRVTSCFHARAVGIVGRAFPIKGDVLNLDQFLTARHITCSDSPGSTSIIDVLCDRFLKSKELHRSIVLRGATPSSVARIVASTDMIALLPEQLAQDFARYVPVRCVSLPIPLPPVEVNMVWHERSQKDPGHAWLRAQFHKVFPVIRAVTAS